MYDVIVVGGGIAGLVAVTRLYQRNPELKLLLLEARDRVGGRTQSISLHDYNLHIDVGGTW